jgi:hypothetical protein
VILLGQRSPKHRQEAIARYLLEHPAILMYFPLGQGIEGTHLAMQGLKIHRRLTIRSCHQGATEEGDELALPLGHTLDRKPCGGGIRRRG